MSTQDQQPQKKHVEDEQFSIAIVPEATAIEEEPTSIPEPSDKGPASTTTESLASAAKQSRLSMAFHKISCGLCFHPLKNNSGVDYHQLVHTPTEEDGPFFGQDSDCPGNNIDGTVVMPRDILHDNKESTADHHLAEASGSATRAESSHLESKERTQVHDQVQEDEPPAVLRENVIPTFVEEFTVDEDPLETSEEITVLSRDVAEEPTATATLAVVQEQEEPTVTASPRAITTNVVTPVASPTSSPARSRAAGAFAKLTKRSSPSATPTPASNSSSPTSSVSSSPLLERLGRFAKVIRPSDTTTSSFQTTSSSLSTSSQKVVESLEIASRITSDQTHVQETAKVVTVSSPVEVEKKNEGAQVQWTHATPPLPPAPVQQQQQQQQQPHQISQVNKRHSLVLDTAASFLNSTSTSPVPIPGQSPIHPWTTHSPTLHQNDASVASQVTHTGSGSVNSTRSLSRVGRASTLDSTLEGTPGSDAGSLSSSTKEGSAPNSQGAGEGFMSKTTKRRKNVMKKLGKIINNINTKEGKEAKASKRSSRQGSMTLDSPLAMSPTAE
ncbi:hypothetical protein EMPS_00240 [Entomortierella parvispora]|uniref:C2H2-type domain-containing protein n=1 Tax=Entomortierella parvispora TaxID=205924 RepID=A0A9P3H028_9FUNG|nr:hypothetical protein EMPS_00240 [Entomortierella parvispora]